jgi:serpin B
MQYQWPIVFAVVSLIFVFTLFSACVTEPLGNSTQNKLSNPELNVVDANNNFAFNLYSHLNKYPRYNESNLVFSPFGISSALVITYEGARGNTATEIQSVSYIPINDTRRRSEFADIINRLNESSESLSLHTVNALWAEKNYTFLPVYTSSIQRNYQANLTNLDFGNRPEESRLEINSWVENNTNSEIKDIIPVGLIDPQTKLVITNAVLFSGKWQTPFDVKVTSDQGFHVSSNRTETVRMMHGSLVSVYNYTENNILQMIELPYQPGQNKTLSMLVILPKGNNLTTVKNTLDAKSLSGLRKSLKPTEVFVSLPKFRFNTKESMSGILSEMGMPTAFGQNANFSGMDGTENLHVQEILHKTSFEIDEAGTRATSGNVVTIEYRSIKPIFRADHPFIFLVIDDETGMILFMGTLMNPNTG